MPSSAPSRTAGPAPVTAPPLPAAPPVAGDPVPPDRRGRFPRREPRVVAVLVAGDERAGVLATLAAVAGSDRAPDLLVGVDVGSRDGTADVLATATSRVLRMPRGARRTDAISAATAALAADPDVAEVAAHTDWLWLLEPGALPDPTALRSLLETVETALTVGIAGCKQVDADGSLRDVGFTASRLGAVVTGVDRLEVDQGQHDGRCDVLAVSTAGMLIRHDVWQRLQGTDPALSRTRADLDLCRRAHLAGFRVVVVPEAAVRHAVLAPRRGRLPAGRTRAFTDRRETLHLRLATAPWWAVPLLVLGSLLAGPGRFCWRLLVKQPRAALDELAAAPAALARPLALWRSRRRQAAAPARRRALRTLLPTPRQVWRQRRDDATAFLYVPEQPGVVSRPAEHPARTAEPPSSEEPSGEGSGSEAPLPALRETGDLPRSPGPRAARPVTALFSTLPVALAAVLGATSLHALLGRRGTPVGDALLPLPDAGALWRAGTSPWRTSGLGSAAVGDPLDAVLAVLALPLGGSGSLLARLLLVAALPIAAWSAWFAAGRLTGAPGLRAAAALLWCASPVLLFAISGGRLGALLAHLLLPLTATALAAAFGLHGDDRSAGARSARAGSARARPPSLAAASVSGLLLVAVVSAAPSLLPAVPVVLVLLAVAAVRAGRGRWTSAWTAVWVAAIPCAVLLPWILALGRRPRLIFAEPGDPAVPSGPPASPWWHLAGLPGDPRQLAPGTSGLTRDLASIAGSAAGWASALAVVAAVALAAVAVAALVSLVRAEAVGAALLAWTVGMVGLALALAAERVVTGVVPTGLLRGWSGPGLSLFALAVGAAAVLGTRPGLRPRTHRAVRAVAALGAAAIVLAAVGVLGAWARGSLPERVYLAGSDITPGLAAADAAGPAGSRTLVIAVGPSAGSVVRWNLLRGPGPRTGDDSAAARVAALGTRRGDAAVVEPLLARLLSDSGDDVRPELLALGVATLQLVPPLDDATALSLDAAPGLVRSGSTGGSLIWRVDAGSGTAPAWARVTDASGAPVAVVPARRGGAAGRVGADGGAHRRLVLAERADRGWHATWNSAALRPSVSQGWAQAFELPDGAGRVVVDRRERWSGIAAPVGWIALVVALLVAVPLPRVRRRSVAAPRPSQPLPRGGLHPARPARPRGAPLADEDAARRWLTREVPAVAEPGAHPAGTPAATAEDGAPAAPAAAPEDSDDPATGDAAELSGAAATVSRPHQAGEGTR